MILLGKRIKELRKNQNMTQQQLGNLLNVTKVSVCCYEKGTRIPSLETLLDLSNIFNVNIDYFLGNDKYVISDNHDSYTIKMSNSEIEFIKEIRNHHHLYEMIMVNPKRGIELLEKKLR